MHLCNLIQISLRRKSIELFQLLYNASILLCLYFWTSLYYRSSRKFKLLHIPLSSIEKKKKIFAIKSTLWWCKLQSFWISKISGGCTFDRNTNSIEKFFNLSYALPCICHTMDELDFWQDFLNFRGKLIFKRHFKKLIALIT